MYQIDSSIFKTKLMIFFDMLNCVAVMTNI